MQANMINTEVVKPPIRWCCFETRGEGDGCALLESEELACRDSRLRTVSAEATFLPAPGEVAVAAPTALDRASTGRRGCFWMYPSTMPAAKLSPHPTVSCTSTCEFQTTR